MDEASPGRAPPGKHKAWWRPDVMEPLRREAAQTRKTLKKENTPQNREAYTKAQNAFGRAVKEQKTDRWRLFLSQLTHENLFTAKKFAMGKSPSQLIQTLITKDGKVCESNNEKAHLLFNTTCVATAPCNMEGTVGPELPAARRLKAPERSAPSILRQDH